MKEVWRLRLKKKIDIKLIGNKHRKDKVVTEHKKQHRRYRDDGVAWTENKMEPDGGRNVKELEEEKDHR